VIQPYRAWRLLVRIEGLTAPEHDAFLGGLATHVALWLAQPAPLAVDVAPDDEQLFGDLLDVRDARRVLLEDGEDLPLRMRVLERIGQIAAPFGPEDDHDPPSHRPVVYSWAQQ
jgi:hypothetical protein